MSTYSVPPCQAACPIHTNVRGYVAAIAKGDQEEAYRIIRQVNPFPSSCGRICTRPCESRCRRAQVDTPVSIRALKRFAADTAKNIRESGQPAIKYTETIAIIGSGPAGLTAAHDLARLGYKVTLYEEQKKLGGMLREGIPDYRLPKDLVQDEVEAILSLGVEAKTGLSLGKDISLDSLLNEYQAVFIAVGSQKSLMPQFKGVELKGVIAAVEFLKQVSREMKPHLGDKVVIIGGGHTAVDAARTSVRLGATDVTIVYRRTVDEMPAGREEAEAAEKEGVKILYLAAPVEFTGEENVGTVKCIRMKLGEKDASGRNRPVPVDNSEFAIEADTVILAIGYTPDPAVLRESGLELNRKGTVLVKDSRGMTSIGGVFAAGDVVSGPLSVIDAIASGRRVAETIHRFFRNLEDKEPDKYIPLVDIEDKVFVRIPQAERQKMPVLEREKCLRSFDEVDLGFTPEQAAMEAQRCLNCGAGAQVSDTCASCLNCVRICPFEIPMPGREIAEIDLSQCQACGICASECPASAIHLGVESRHAWRMEVDRVIERAREETPEILIIGVYCRYGSPVGPPFEGENVYWIGTFCTGRLNETQFLYLFEAGVEGVAVHGCGDEACHFINGGNWAKRHLASAGRILHDTGIGAERLCSVSDEEEFFLFREKIEDLGINPVRKGKKVGV